MISSLRGTVLALTLTGAVIETGGVGMSFLAPPSTLSTLRPGQEALVHTELVVREDSLTLYGFTDAEERDAFELVQTASGIGPKLAQAVVSVLPPDELRAAILSENLVALCKVPGIGRKGAQKMVIELKDKVNALGAIPDLSTGAPRPGADDWRDQVAAGLESLGWSAKDAAAAVEGVAGLRDEDPNLGIGDLMRAALRSLAR